MKNCKQIGAVLETRNYSQFRRHEFNRGVVRRPKLIASMKKHGWIATLPMSVKRNGVGFVILDGQHRFEAAKELGIPIRFSIVEEAELFRPDQLNGRGLNKPWDPVDFVMAYAAQGSTAFVELLQMAETSGLDVLTLASLLRGQSALSQNHTHSIRDGSYTIKDREFAKRVIAIVDACRQHVNFATKRNFVDAISKCVRVPGFDCQDFIDKVGKTSYLLRDAAHSDDFIDQIEELYNHRSRTKLPVAFQAKELARARQRDPKGNGAAIKD